MGYFNRWASLGSSIGDGFSKGLMNGLELQLPYTRKMQEAKTTGAINNVLSNGSAPSGGNETAVSRIYSPEEYNAYYGQYRR